MAIGDAGQLSRVARLLHVTQSALSKALAKIERSIGEPAFERTGAGLVPNRRGATLIRAARAALAELERAGDELERQARAQDRTLAVGAVPLYGDPLVIVAAPGHPLARRIRAGWGDCVEHPWVLPPPGHPTRIAFERALRRAGLASPGHVIGVLSNNLVIGLLAHSHALSLVPQRHARALAQSGLMQIVAAPLAASLGLSMEVTAFVQSGRADAADARSMLERLREAAGPRNGLADLEQATAAPEAATALRADA